VEVNIHQAKTHLSRLLQRVAGGEEVTIAHAGVPVARLVPIEPSGVKRKLGIDHGKVWIAEDFDAPFPELEALFEGEDGPRGRKTKRR
jgi:prevent-host-death family protein